MLYDAVGNLTKETDALGRITEHFYDKLQQRIRTEGPAVAGGRPVERWTFDAAGNVSTYVDALGRTTSYTYDAADRRTVVTDALGGTTSTAYDKVGNVTAKIDASGHRTEFTYDDLNRLVRESRPAPGAGSPLGRAVTSRTYDAVGNELTTTDALGRVTTRTYDVRNRLISEVDALGGVTGMTYDAIGNVLTSTDALGRVTTYAYDGLDRRVRIVQADPDGAGGPATAPVTQLLYDAAGNLLSTIDALGRTTSFEYDALNRQVKTTDAAGAISSRVYDAVGNVIRATDPLGRVTEAVFDALNRAIETSEPPPSATGARRITRKVYDLVGNVVSATDGRGNVTQYAYDALDRQIRTIDAAGGLRSVTYDAVGNVISSTDERAFVTTYTYDAQNRRVTTTEPDPDGLAGPGVAPITRYTYDAVGNVIRVTDPRGHATAMTYDALDRLVKTVDAIGGVGEREYDAVGNVLASVDALGRRTEYAYDALDRLVLTTQPAADTGAARPTTAYTYDAFGNVLTEKDALGRVTAYTYDAMDRQITVTDAIGGVTRMAYDLAGRLVRMTDALGHASRFEYDALDRRVATFAPDADGGGPLGEAVTRFAYDANDNLVSVTDPLGHVTQYGYDVLDRRVEVIDARGASSTMTYDASGNLLSLGDVLGRITTNEYDGLGRLIKTTAPDPDGASGPLATPVRTFRYDAADNLIETKDPLGNATTYAYDDLNRRVLVTDALGGETATTYDAVGNVIATSDTLGRVTTNTYDNLDRLVTNTAPDPDGATGAGTAPVTGLEYDLVGNLVKITDALGHATTFTYDDLDRRSGVTDALGGTATTEYDAVGNATATIDVLGRRTTFKFDALRRLVETTQPDPDGSGPLSALVSSYEYDIGGNLVATTDALGRVTSYTYDVLNRRTKVTDAAGGISETLYDAAGRVVALIDPLSHRTDFAFDNLDRQVAVTEADPDGAGPLTPSVTTSTYDAAGNLLAVTDALGRTTSFEYDALNRIVVRQDALGQRSALVRDAVGNVTASTDALGRTTTFRFDALDRVVETRSVDPDGSGAQSASVTTTDYDALGNVMAMTDALGRRTTFAYDALNRRIRATDAMGGDARSSYDAAGNVLTSTDVLGRVTSFQYDALNRVVRVTAPAPTASAGSTGPTTTYAYDAMGNTVATTDALGRTTRYTYDALDRRTRTTDALGGVTAVTYDAAGRMTSVTDPVGRTTRHVYDARNRRVQTIAPDAAITTFTYDAVGHVTGVTDALGHVTTTQFDALDRIVASIDAIGGVTARAYDAVGNLVRVTDPVGNVTSYVYDGLDRRVSETDPLGAVRRFTYDAVGNGIESIDALGRRIVTVFDDLDRPVEETWSTGGASVRVIHRTFDAAGELTRIADPDGVYTMQYDGLGRTVRVASDAVGGAPAVTLDYTYDAVGNVLSVADTIGGAAGGRTTYTIDALNRVVGVAQTGAGVVGRRVELVYDAAAQITGIQRFASAVAGTAAVSSAYGYDVAGRVTSITHSNAGGAIATFAQTWDALGRLTGVTSTDGTAAFGYDALGQVITSDYSYQTDENFGFDANGNRIGSGYATTVGNRVAEDSQFTYVYDAEGNRVRQTDKVTGEVTAFAWDHRDRLVGVVRSDAGGTVLETVQYQYDALGRKVGRIHDADGAAAGAAVSERYVFAGQQVAMVFATGSTQPSERFMYGPGIDLVLAEQRGSTLLWTLADHLNTVRDVTSADGVLRNHLRYSTFGVITSQTDATFAPRFSYTGREFDAATGLYSYRARWYDANMGRFLSQDATGFAAGDMNLYRYVGNRPTFMVDPSGNQGVLSRIGNVFSGVSASETANNMLLGLSYGMKDVVGAVAGETAGRIAGEGTATVLGLGKGVVTGAIGLVEGVAWLGKTAAAATLQAAAHYTGSEKLQGWANKLSKDTLDPLMDLAASLQDPCVDKFALLTGGVHNWLKTQNQLAKDGKKIEGALNAGELVGSAAFNLASGPLMAEAVAAGAAKAAKAVSTIAGLASDAGNALGRAGTALRAMGTKVSRAAGAAVESLQSAGRGARLEARVADAAAEAAESAVRAEKAVTAMKAERVAKEAKRAQTSEALAPLWDEMRAKGWTPETKRHIDNWVEHGIDPPAYTGSKSIIVERVKPGSVLGDLANGVKQAVKDIATKIGGPQSGATARQQGVIKAFAAENELEIAIRATDPITAAGTKIGTHLGLPGKPESIKAKSWFGILQDSKTGQMLRSDLDLAWVKDRKTGRFLTNQEVLDRVVDPLNKRLIMAGDKEASLFHGAHFTMGAEKGGYVSRAGIKKIGDAGPVNLFTGEGMSTLSSATARATVAAGDAEAAATAARAAATAATVAAAAKQTGYENVLHGIAENLQGAFLNKGLERLIDKVASRGIDDVPSFERHWSMTGQCGPAAYSQCALFDEALGAALVDVTFMKAEGGVQHAFTQGRVGTRYFVGDSSFHQFSRPGELNFSERIAELSSQPGPYNRLREGGLATFDTAEQADAFVADWMRAVSPDTPTTLERVPVASWATDMRMEVESLAEAARDAREVLTHAPLRALEPSIGAGADEGHTIDSTTAALALADLAQTLWADSATFIERQLIRVSIADLPEGQLGEAYITHLGVDGAPSEGRIVIDWNADGRGWFVDPTPYDDAEFRDPSSAAFGRFDLFSVIAHEVGHTLGFLAGYAGYDRFVRTLEDGSVVFEAPGVRAALSSDADHLSDALFASDLMSDSLGTYARKLPSEIAGRIIAAARGAQAPSVADTAVEIGGAHLDPALPDAFVNGDFSIGDPALAGFGWQLTGGASVADGRGRLDETTSLDSRLNQRVALPVGAKTLQFTITDAQFDAVGSGPQDAFEVALLDPLSNVSLTDVVDLTHTDALLNIQADGTLRTASGVTIAGLTGNTWPRTLGTPVTVSIDLTTLSAPEGMSLYFDLLGFGERGSHVSIDDVRFTFEEGTNRAPTATNDARTLAEDGTLAIDIAGLVGNDIDLDGDALTFTLVDTTQHGTLVDQGSGSFVYTPVANFFGTDTFTYRVNDGQVDSNLATVTLTVDKRERRPRRHLRRSAAAGGERRTECRHRLHRQRRRRRHRRRHPGGCPRRRHPHPHRCRSRRIPLERHRRRRHIPVRDRRGRRSGRSAHRSRRPRAQRRSRADHRGVGHRALGSALRPQVRCRSTPVPTPSSSGSSTGATARPSRPRRAIPTNSATRSSSPAPGRASRSAPSTRTAPGRPRPRLVDVVNDRLYVTNFTANDSGFSVRFSRTFVIGRHQPLRKRHRPAGRPRHRHPRRGRQSRTRLRRARRRPPGLPLRRHRRCPEIGPVPHHPVQPRQRLPGRPRPHPGRQPRQRLRRQLPHHLHRRAEHAARRSRSPTPWWVRSRSRTSPPPTAASPSRSPPRWPRPTSASR